MRVRLAAAAAIAMALATACASDGSDTASRAASGSSPTPVESVSSPTVPNLPTTSAPRTFAADAFNATDAALDARVQAAGIGGMVRMVAADGSVIHEHANRGFTADTPLSIASATKWFTAATFMTFVDDGVIGLDDDIGRWLPEFAGSTPAITPRQLLDGTSGVRDHSCQNGDVALADCVRTLAASPREFPAGTRYSYGNSPFLVVGRLVEELGRADFATVVDDRLTGPLGMSSTTWPGAPGTANPAFGAQTTVDDYGRFLAMLLREGSAGPKRVLSPRAVAEMVTNQVSGYDTTHDYSVGITGVPRYGLGCWIDVEGPSGRAVVASGSGGLGLYPWVDFTTRTYGIVGVQDARGAELAVPASQRVAIEARTAVAG